MIDILVQFNTLDSESRKRDVNAWRPVVFTIVQAISEFDDLIFKETLGLFYKELCGLMVDDIGADMKYILRGIFMRCGVMFSVVLKEEDLQVKCVESEVQVIDLVKSDTSPFVLQQTNVEKRVEEEKESLSDLKDKEEEEGTNDDNIL